MIQNNNDQQLIQQVLHGNKQAFDVLVKKYQQRLISQIAFYVNDTTEAKDIIQDSLLKAYTSLPYFRGESTFYTWLNRITLNTAKTHLQINNTKHMRQVSIHDCADIQHLLIDPDSPEKLLVCSEIENAISTAIAKLPEDLKTAILMREIAGSSYEEIANTMQCPIGTVRSRIFRARELIDKEIHSLVR